MDDTTPRRPKQVIADRERLLALLDSAVYGFLALSRDDEPYVVPVSFARDGDTLIIHSAPEGKKIAWLRANPQACQCVVPRAAYVTGRANFSYDSVIAYGRIEFLESIDAKRAAYEALIRKYEPGREPAGDTCIARSAILALRIEKLTGKRGTSDA